MGKMQQKILIHALDLLSKASQDTHQAAALLSNVPEDNYTRRLKTEAIEPCRQRINDAIEWLRTLQPEKAP
jgi:hypothetical protein